MYFLKFALSPLALLWSLVLMANWPWWSLPSCNLFLHLTNLFWVLTTFLKGFKFFYSLCADVSGSSPEWLWWTTITMTTVIAAAMEATSSGAVGILIDFQRRSLLRSVRVTVTLMTSPNRSWCARATSWVLGPGLHHFGRCQWIRRGDGQPRQFTTKEMNQ